MPNGKIRELKIFNKLNDGFGWVVGKEYSAGPSKRVVVSQIVRDENSFFLHGVLRYTIYVYKLGDDSKEEILFRHYENCSVEVICDID